MDTLTLRNKQLALLEIVGRLSFLRGSFVLASGQKSTWYYDGKMTQGDPEGTALIGEIIFELLRNADVQAVGGLASGAISIGNSVSIASRGTDTPLPNFWVREETKSHGTQKLLEGQFPKAKGARVAIVEDVITTGGSVEKAIQRVEEDGAQVQCVIVIMDRLAGGSKKLRHKGYKVIALFEATENGDPYIVDLGQAREEVVSGVHC